ncbi:hypothetical protein HBB16_16495 [Pseudonocardia sp. MCCB 268]|nr:hypothetical protein [Pseudonocardia cytotoxica]
MDDGRRTPARTGVRPMQLAVLDLAGTTMADDGLVLAAVRAGLRAARSVDGPRLRSTGRPRRWTGRRSPCSASCSTATCTTEPGARLRPRSSST